MYVQSGLEIILEQQRRWGGLEEHHCLNARNYEGVQISELSKSPGPPGRGGWQSV